MADAIDQEGRASFVRSLPRKVTELRATLGTLVADPKSQRMRDELRRRLHALYTLTRSYQLPTLSEGLREGIAHLDAVRGATVLNGRDLEMLADLIATLPALAQRDLPDQPELFQRPRDLGPGSAPVTEPPPSDTARGAASGAAGADAGDTGSSAARPSAPPRRLSVPPMPSKRHTSRGMPAVRPPAEIPLSAPPSVRPPPPSESRGASVPMGLLVVGGEGLATEARRVLPQGAEFAAVRTLSEAVSAARDTAPDVIIADCAPPADGLGLLAALRGDPLTDFLPVVLVCTSADAVDADAARAQGASDVLVRPFAPERLREAVDRTLNVLATPSLPPPDFGEVTLEELTRALQEEIRRGILGAAGPRAGSSRISLGQGSEVLAATWEAIARVRDVIEKKTQGRVRFQMPAAPLGLGGAHVLSMSEAPVEDEVLAGGDDPLPGRRALVVDDDPSVVWFFAGLLREAGMAVTECTDGATALKDARRNRPDVVISDILMPGVDGFALCRAIRRDVALRNTPIILLSWKEDLLIRMRELGAQAQGFLRKESKGEAILSRVRHVLRPRVRLLRRLEALADGAELRGRLERIGVFSLLEAVAKSPGDASVTITDSFSVTELEVRERTLVSIVRTAQDGSLSRGEGALLQVLGTSNGRFAVRRSRQAVRSNIHGELESLLAGGSALITAIEDSVSGAALLDVVSVDLDGEAALSYARSLPDAMRKFVERLVQGESPRNLVLRDGIAPQEIEPVLVELARRGTIRSVRGAEGADLVGPRFAVAMAGDSLRPAERQDRISETMPAVLAVPRPPLVPSAESAAAAAAREAPPPAPPPAAPIGPFAAADAAAASAPVDAGPPARKSGSRWVAPTTIDEAARPGFGLEGESDSLATAVLRELSDPPAVASRETPEEPLDASALIEVTEPARDEPVEQPLELSKRASHAPPPVVDAPPAATVDSAKVESAEDESAKDESPPGDATPDVPKTQGEADGPAGTLDATDQPEFDDGGEEETDLTPDEIERALRDAPDQPIKGVTLDARGMPRQMPSRASVDDLPEINGPNFSPHERAKKPVEQHDSTVIVDPDLVGGPVETGAAPRRSNPPGRPTRRDLRGVRPGRGGASNSSSVTETERQEVEAAQDGSWMPLVVGALVLAGVTYFGVRYFLQTQAASTAAADAGVASSGDDDVAVPNVVPTASDVRSTAVDAVASDAPGTVAPGSNVAPSDGAALPAEATYEPLGNYLDGGTIAPDRGLLVVDGPPGAQITVTIDQRPAGSVPLRTPLFPGMHNVRYESHRVTGYRFVTIAAGRAIRIVLPAEP